MKDFPRSLTAVLLVFTGGILGLGTGCSVFIPTHDVAVDAISGQIGAPGLSYRLVDKNPQLARNAQAHFLAMTSVSAALETKGMFAAPPNLPPEIVVEVDYGMGRPVPDPSGQPLVEKFLELSARKFVADPAVRTRGDEIWNVRVSTQEAGGGVEIALPLLAAVAVDYAGQDTRAEQVITVKENSPTVSHIKSVVNSALAAEPRP